MNIKKLFAYLVVAILAVVLWNDWKKTYGPQAAHEQAAVLHSKQKKGEFTPSSFNPGAAPSASQPSRKVESQSTAMTATKPASKQLIRVETDLLQVEIDRVGGNIIGAKLKKYPVSLSDKDKSVQLLNSNPKNYYVMQSNYTALSPENSSGPNLLFSSAKTHYVLDKNKDQLSVSLVAHSKSGLTIRKAYTFTRDKYAIGFKSAVHNQSSKPWTGSFYLQLLRKEGASDQKYFGMKAYRGASYSSPETPYKKLSFKEMSKQDLNQNIKGGWAAMQQHYFLSAWIPEPGQEYHYYSHTNDEVYTIGMVYPQSTLKPGATLTQKATFFVGPELTDRLKKLAPGLDLTIDYGWLTVFSKAIFWVMQHIYQFIGNWGWSIVLVTLLIKLAFYHLSTVSFRSMAKMRELQPRIAALKERYGDDKQKLSQATMEMYRSSKVNPMGGCLPMLIQIPVFFALYYVLIESVQLRQAPFIFWIHDLSIKDPFYVLPILMGISMFVQQRLSPQPADAAQAKMMMVLPVIFTVLFLNFPAGLVLYWLINNCAQTLHQWYALKKFSASSNKKR